VSHNLINTDRPDLIGGVPRELHSKLLRKEYLVTGDAITAITADFSPSGLEEVLAQLGMELS